MPRIQSFEEAAQSVTNVADRLQAAGNALEGARTEVSVDRVYALLHGVGSDLVQAGAELRGFAAKLRNASAELESIDGQMQALWKGSTKARESARNLVVIWPRKSP